ncbi:MAG: hypothetical protein WA418_21670 [Bradyrhizobium sp.]
MRWCTRSRRASTFYNHPAIAGVTAPPKGRLVDMVERTERFTKKSDGSPFVRKTPITSLDISGQAPPRAQ